MTVDATPRRPRILRDLLACAFCDKGVATTGLIFRQRLLARMILETPRLILRLFREEDVAEPANCGQLIHQSAAISRMT